LQQLSFNSVNEARLFEEVLKSKVCKLLAIEEVVA
jgi:hypothetical protein